MAEAYGWPANLTEQETLARLVALNAERADEERRGIVRWLRPEFQAPGATGGGAMEQEDFAGEGSQAPADEATPATGKAKGRGKGKPGPGGRRDPARDLQIRLADWPATLAEQAIAVRSPLSDATGPATPADLARAFAKVHAPKVEAILRTLTALGQARRTDAGGYVATG